jgi:AcrR family transcriptional regulator
MPESILPDPEPVPTRPGPVPSLSLDDIAAAAVDLADEHGLDAVTMRSVGTAVGVSAAGLYRYVTSRDELVGRMVDRLSAEVVHPPPTGDWVADLTLAAEEQLRVFRAHSWMAQAVGSLRHLGPYVLDHLDWGLEVLRPVDATVGRKLEAIALVNGVAALFSTAGQPPGPETFAHLDPARQPHLAEAFAVAPAAGPSEDLFARVVAGLLGSLLGPASGGATGPTA